MGKKVFSNKINVAFLVFLASVCCCYASARQQNVGRDIKALWDKFEKAEALDKPGTALTYLGLIKSYALSSRLPVDYYNACKKAYQVELRTDWKSRDSLVRRLDLEVDGYCDPMVTVFHRLFSPAGRDRDFSADSLRAYIMNNESSLRKSFTPGFLAEASVYVKVRSLLEKGKFFDDNYQNALWLLSVAASDRDALQLLIKETGQSYPQAAWLEYYSLSTSSYTDRNGRRDALIDFASRYSGKAAALLAQEDILDLSMDELETDGKGTSQDYLGLREECKSLIARQKSFSGDEKALAACCVYASNLLERLESPEAYVSAEDGVVTVTMRNLKSVNLTLKKGDNGDEVWKCVIENPVNSFYRVDTAKVNIPVIDDGEYILYWSARDVSQNKIEYHKYSISVACRIKDGRYEIFAADAISGKPLDSVSGFGLNGFTPVPHNIATIFSSRRYEPVTFTSVSGDGRKMLSRAVSGYNFYSNDRLSSPYSSTRAVILTDCAAFHPADTVRFKVIAYKHNVREDGSSQMTVLDRGETVKVELIDPEGGKVAENSLTVNEYGSASGEFCLPADRKNGHFRICALVHGETIASSGISVGHYALPSFEILEDKSEIDLYPGDTIRITGKVKSYSGRIISTRRSQYKVSGPEGYSDSGKLELAGDGTYCITVPSVKSGWYSYELIVSDATGETMVYNGGCGVNALPGLSVEICDSADGICSWDGDYRNGGPAKLVWGDVLKLRFGHLNFEGNPTPADVKYSVTGPDGQVAIGQSAANKEIDLMIQGSSSGIYTIEAEAEVMSASGQTFKSVKRSARILIIRKDSDTLTSDVEYFVMAGDEPYEAVLGTTDGDLWAIVNLVSSDGRLLKEKIFHMDGQLGRAGSICRAGFDSETVCEGTVTLNVLWFKNNDFISWNHLYGNVMENDSIPLDIVRFTDQTAPGRQTYVSFKTDPSSELAVTVYDKATENISPLRWNPVRKPGPQTVNIAVSSVCGINGYAGSKMLRGYATAANMLTKSASEIALADGMVAEEESASVEYGNSFESVRDVFQDVVVFEPALYPDADGTVSFSFTPTGKLSTYIVKAYAHDTEVNTAQTSREILISLPVEVSLQTPRFLYVGDKYIARCSVSDTKKSGISGGEVSLTVFDGNDREAAPLMRQSKSVEFKDGLAYCDFEFSSVPACSSGELGLLMAFHGRDVQDNTVSDALMKTVPVYDAVQHMIESHSSVYEAGADRNALLEQLRASFTNIDPYGAKEYESKIADMLPSVLDESSTAKGDDVISHMNALIVRELSAKLNSSVAEVGDLIERISECLNPDGGYAWRAGMESSQKITSYMLAAVSMLKGKDALPAGLADVETSVKYLDKKQFAEKPQWYGLSLEQYLSVRSMFPEVKFGQVLSREQKNAVKEYLKARDEKNLKGNIMGKVRRALTLERLFSGNDESALARAWGISSGTSRRLALTRAMDRNSILQYAVRHKSAGLYFPNAVIPFRGLLESELYVHTLLCDYFEGVDDEVADGLRLWLILQKETQEWKSDPASVLAVAAIMGGSPDLLQTSVISLTAEEDCKFDSVKAASNGFTVACKYYADSSYESSDGKGWVELKDGDTVSAGRRIMLEYSVHNDENRSFVRMNTPHPACLLPEEQLSGPYGYRLYRDVRLNETQWWWDVFPEGDSTFSETFTVSQTGIFQCPATEVTCLYAPHWSANTVSSIIRVTK